MTTVRVILFALLMLISMVLLKCALLGWEWYLYQKALESALYAATALDPIVNIQQLSEGKSVSCQIRQQALYCDQAVAIYNPQSFHKIVSAAQHRNSHIHAKHLIVSYRLSSEVDPYLPQHRLARVTVSLINLPELVLLPGVGITPTLVGTSLQRSKPAINIQQRHYKAVPQRL